MQEPEEPGSKRLERMYKNLDTGMTRNKYLDMCEQLDKEPSDKEIPPDWEDFPEIIREAINTFNQLGDRVFPEIGYVGKDYTNLNHSIEVYEVKIKNFSLKYFLG